MISNHEEYKQNLIAFHILLKKYNEDRWADYFSACISLFEQGKKHKCMKHFLIAFGGMGSFNDQVIYTGASERELKTCEFIASSLYRYSASNYSRLKCIFE